MTGVGWLDAGAFALFVGLATLLAAQLVRDRSDPAGAVLHLTMAVGMAAMSQPRLDPVVPEVWMVAFLTTAAGTLVLCLGHRSRGDRPLTRPYNHVVASLLMVVAFASHGAHGTGAGTHTMIDPTTGSTTTMSDVGMGGHRAVTSALAQSIGATATSPIWRLVGVGFVAYALWLTAGLVPITRSGLRRADADAVVRCAGSMSERVCGVVMAAAMGVMALTL